MLSQWKNPRLWLLVIDIVVFPFVIVEAFHPFLTSIGDIMSLVGFVVLGLTTLFISDRWIYPDAMLDFFPLTAMIFIAQMFVVGATAGIYLVEHKDFQLFGLGVILACGACLFYLTRYLILRLNQPRAGDWRGIMWAIFSIDLRSVLMLVMIAAGGEAILRLAAGSIFGMTVAVFATLTAVAIATVFIARRLDLPKTWATCLHTAVFIWVVILLWASVTSNDVSFWAIMSLPPFLVACGALHVTSGDRPVDALVGYR